MKRGDPFGAERQRLQPGRLAASLAGVVCLALLLASVAGASGLGPLGGRSGPSRAERAIAAAQATGGEVIVVLRTREKAARDVALEFGVSPRQIYQTIFAGFVATLSDRLIERFANDPRVLAITPNLPVFAEAQTLTAGVDRVDADEWPGNAMTGDGIEVDADVAVLDSGIAPLGDLNVQAGVNTLTSNQSGGNINCFETANTGDIYSHGTHVSGIIGARDNASGVVGVAPGVRLWPVKVLSDAGSGTYSSIICGLEWVVSHGGIDVINMSLSGAGSDGACESDALHLAICNTVNAGVSIVVATGNQGGSAAGIVPATFDQVIAVVAFADFDGQAGGLDSTPPCGTPYGDDRYAAFSNDGADVDIAAPGVCVTSTLPNGSLGSKSGTSMATAHVTGAIALYKASNPGASPSQVRSWLLSSGLAQSSPFGFSGNDDGVFEPVLSLGDGSAPPVPTGTPTMTPTATKTPTATNAPTNTPTATATSPGGIGGSELPLVASGGSSGATYTGRVRDDDLATDWHTTFASPPANGYVYVDLGSTKSLTGVRWVFNQTGAADSVQIQLSTNKSSWTTVATVGNAPALAWQLLPVNGSARYVRFYFTNVNNDVVLGYLAEIKVWGTSGGAGATPTATKTPTPGPTATKTPTPTGGTLSGEALPLVASGGSSGATYTGRVRDNNLTTDWHTTFTSPPANGYVYVDLGSTKSLTGVRWVFNQTGSADSVQIQVSTNKSSWTTVGTIGNVPALAWQQLPFSANARFVRFYFTNPNSDIVLGYLAEVEVWGSGAGSSAQPHPEGTRTPAPPATATPTTAPTATPTPTPTDPLEGTPLPLTGGGGSTGATWTGRVRDGDPETDWHTTLETSPATAYVYVDLGSVQPVVGVRWLFNQTGFADQWELQVSTDKVTWTKVYDEGNAPPLAWQERPLDLETRYVRFFFKNPENDVSLGYLAEVEVWGPLAAAEAPTEPAIQTDTPAPTATDTPVPPATATLVPTETPPVDATPYPVAGLSASANGAVSPAVVLDGDPTTYWYATEPAPPAAADFTLDLGAPVPIGTIRWLWAVDGNNDEVVIQVSEDGETWTTVADASGAPAGTWQEASAGVTARFVRVVFANPNGDAELGGLAELEIWP